MTTAPLPTRLLAKWPCSQAQAAPQAAAPRRLALSILLALAGCAQTGGIAPQAALRSPQSLGAVTQAAAHSDAAPAQAAWPRPDWWAAYGDAELSRLIEQALRDSPSLRVAGARLEQAVAAAQAAGAELTPQAQLTAQTTRQRLSETYLYPTQLAGEWVNDNVLRLGVGWDLDLFGRKRAALEAAIGAQRASEADRAAARWVLSTQVARGYVQLARAVALREVAAAARQQREQSRGLVADRVRAGLDTQVELRQAEGAVPQSRQSLEALDEQIALARHQLAYLTGAAPASLDGLTPRLAALPQQVLPPVIPAELIGRRPDLVGARWRVEAAHGGVAAARAAFYPNVNLAAFAGLHSLGLDRWLQSGSRELGVTPAVTLPVFEGGRLRANLRARAAEADAAIETYNQTLATAVREVADALASVRSVERQGAHQAAAQAAAESAYELALARYQAGLGTYLTVLSAEGNLLSERRQAAELKARALDAQLALVRALGGGYAGDLPAARQPDAAGAAATAVASPHAPAVATHMPASTPTSTR
jgi:NodT family efflux transporter outer membrane factor (OMF) lipoprotein